MRYLVVGSQYDCPFMEQQMHCKLKCVANNVLMGKCDLEMDEDGFPVDCPLEKQVFATVKDFQLLNEAIRPLLDYSRITSNMIVKIRNEQVHPGCNEQTYPECKTGEECDYFCITGVKVD